VVPVQVSSEPGPLLKYSRVAGLMISKLGQE